VDGNLGRVLPCGFGLELDIMVLVYPIVILYRMKKFFSGLVLFVLFLPSSVV